MLEQLKNIIRIESKYYLLGATSTNQMTDYYVMLVKNVSGELVIEERFKMTSFNEIKKDIPVILHVDGGGIINKQVKKETGYRSSLVFGSNTEDFHFYEFHQDTDIYASIARKSYVNELLSNLANEGLAIVHLSIGPFVIANFLPMITGDRSVYVSDYIIEVENGKIMSFSNDGVALETQKINGEELNFKEIPLMASMLNYLYPITSLSFNNESIYHNREEYKFKKLFKVSGIFALAFILVSLISGHFLLNDYTKKLAEKSVEYSMYQQSVEKIRILQNEKELKEKILFNSGIKNENFLSKYASEIGNTVPKDITLISIDVMAPNKKIRPDKKVELALNTINIVGTTYNDNSFNKWMDGLRKIDWVQDINIEYQEDRKVNNTFTLKVKI